MFILIMYWYKCVCMFWNSGFAIWYWGLHIAAWGWARGVGRGPANGIRLHVRQFVR